MKAKLSKLLDYIAKGIIILCFVCGALALLAGVIGAVISVWKFMGPPLLVLVPAAVLIVWASHRVDNN